MLDLQDFRSHLIAIGRLPRTVQTYLSITRKFLEHHQRTRRVSSDAPARRDIEAFLARPTNTGQPRRDATRNQELAALLAFGHYAQEQLDWAENPAAGIRFGRQADSATPTFLSAAEVHTLFATAAKVGSPALRARNLAILSVLVLMGLRVHEAVGLNLAQLDMHGSTLLGVRGKRGKVRHVEFGIAAHALLSRWIQEREQLAASDEPSLFVSTNGSRISIRQVQRFIASLRQPMGTSKPITPHAMRHTFGTLLVERGVDVETVAQLMGHSDLNTTKLYLHLVDTRRRDAVHRLDPVVPANLLDGTKVATRLDIQTYLDDAA